MNKRNTTWLAAGGLSLALSLAAFAHNGATGVVGERMMGMMMLAEQVKLLTPLLASERSPDPQILQESANMIRMHAGPAMTSLFPEGSTESPSEAQPEIWTNWEEFTGYANRLEALGAELAQSSVPAAVPSRPATEPVAVTKAPEIPEWERLDFATLIGLSPTVESKEVSIDSLITGSISTDSASPVPQRSPEEILADITATCSSCHAEFRR